MVESRGCQEDRSIDGGFRSKGSESDLVRECDEVFIHHFATEHRRANQEAQLGCEEVKLMRDEMRLSREANERTNLAIIDILKQGLL